MRPLSRHRNIRTRKIARAVAMAIAALIVGTLAVGFWAYRHLEGNIDTLELDDALGTDRPTEVMKPNAPNKPLDILVMGSDTREGQGNNIGGETPGLSDTTILLHLSAERDRAYGVSLPRDAMVERPWCERENGQGIDPGGLSMFNAAFAVGGPACTIRTVEQLTGLRIEHFVVVDFSGFMNMVNALGGVPVCVPEEVNDTIGNIHLPAGSYEVWGQQARDYMRVRHGLGAPNGDIGRMKRQQAFLASMANKAISTGTLTKPWRLYDFLDAATQSLTTDPGLDSVKELAGLANQLHGIGLDNIQFLTVPFENYPPDINRVQWAPEAEQLWDRLWHDESLSGRVTDEVITAAEDPEGASDLPSTQPDPDHSQPPSASPPTEADEDYARTEAEIRAANGLCT